VWELQNEHWGLRWYTANPVMQVSQSTVLFKGSSGQNWGLPCDIRAKGKNKCLKALTCNERDDACGRQAGPKPNRARKAD